MSFTFGDIVKGAIPVIKAKMSFEECVLDTLKKEGGAAGLGAIKEALQKEGHSTQGLEAKLKKVPKVSRHKHGDYILSDIGMYKK